MTGLRRFWTRLVSFLRHDRAEVELTCEVDAHLSLIEHQYRQRGLSAADAKHAARRAMGGVEQAKEHHRQARSFAWLDDLARDDDRKH